MQPKMIQDQVEACRCLTMALGDGRVRTLLRRVRGNLPDVVPAGDGSFDLGAVLVRFRRKLGLERNELAAASEDHQALLQDLRAQMGTRDLSVAELLPALVAVKEVLRGLFGGAGLREILGNRRRLPRGPEALRLFGRTLFERLTGEGATLPRPVLPGVDIDPTALADGFKQALVALERSLESINALRQKVATARDLRNTALNRVTGLTRRAARFLAALEDLAGERATVDRAEPASTSTRASSARSSSVRDSST